VTEHWHPTIDLVGRPGMPLKSARSITLFGRKRGWLCRPRTRGNGLEWLESSLPAETQADYQRERAERETSANAAAKSPPADAWNPPLSVRNKADARLDIVTAFQRWRLDHGGTVLFDDQRAFAAAYSAGEIDVSPATRCEIPRVGRWALDDWQRRLRASGWSGLLPRRGGQNKGSGLIDRDPELRDAIIAHILERPGHVRPKTIMRALRVSFEDDRLPAPRTVERFIERWLRDNARLVSAVADPDRHRSKYLPAAGDAAAGVTRVNQVWELDSTPADVICTDGRHAVVGAIDIATRRARLLVVPTSRAVAIAALLRRAILDWGVPETVRTDEGSDYTSRHIRRALADLGVEHDELPPFSPERKPFIERFFGTLTRQLFEQLPGFAGHNVAEAQALRSRKSFAARRGEGDAEAFQVQLSAAELQGACDAWLETVYEREPHSGLDGRSPFEAAAGRPVRRIDDERMLDILLAEPADGGGWRVVSKKGIACEGTIFIAAELGAMVGERVSVRLDPADAGGVYIFDQDGGFVCRAVAPEREGIDRQQIAIAMRKAAKATDAEGRAYARDLKRRVKPEAAIEQILAAGREAAAHVVAFPSPSSAHESPGLEAAAEAAAAAGPSGTGPAAAPDEEFQRRRSEELRAQQDEEQRWVADKIAAMERRLEERRRARDREDERLLALADEAIRKARAMGID